MSLLKKFERGALATTTDLIEKPDGITSVVDAEKAAAAIQEDVNAPGHHHVHPDAEKAVVRKMDWRIPPLVSALCRNQSLCSCLFRSLTEMELRRLVGLPGSVQYRVGIGLATQISSIPFPPHIRRLKLE